MQLPGAKEPPAQNEPAGHVVAASTLLPSPAQYEPAGTVQLRHAVAFVAELNEPARHLVQAVAPFGDHVPTGQSMDCESVGQYSPASQDMHLVEPAAEPKLSGHGVHEVEPEELEYVLGGHGAIGASAVARKLPAGQGTHEDTSVPPGANVMLPAAHKRHTSWP